MKELVVISGKGGTGKTSITASLAVIAKNMVVCDADVDAADLHLLLQPDIRKETDFKGGNTAVIASERCTGCGTCMTLCRFEAVSEDVQGKFRIDSIDCEGCGVCVDFCPEKAIDFPENTCGQWFVSDTRIGPMIHARLGLAEENSGKLVTLIRQEARSFAEKHHLGLIITDGPPGVGCPVIAAIGGAATVLIVTEPTVSGIHDMARAAELAMHFKIPAMICVNKYDLNPEKAAEIERYAERNGMGVVGRIPFDPAFTHAMVAGRTIVEYAPDSEVSMILKKIWEQIATSSAMMDDV
ncbi:MULTISPECIES: ATP-binding protein [Desulfococcus]|uniref:Cobyrinic acid ac-diamide synthase n=1 Tax=Desulfococcus multivorans DSM 2059 TaxID=1121405 RepID=S7U1Z0_DESML|nr:ATP-binding protein [Desulfococcus multivorans]AOY58538.1 cobyrinic acid a,c-diamide synthase [Desulfococcus multivorans]AQV00848.1 (4Fe-4S)-binding protein [Desulfococcus multivorans]EPR43322.1 Cobyrinic acid ac-diamide synthase [Desulfococcus multivorans DSM 2059]SJZ42734.1 MinD superfamily P-loop ATPase, contains an inserted ferredoxin domain [Desulfococcus multivorans DSM 2059]